MLADHCTVQNQTKPWSVIRLGGNRSRGLEITAAYSQFVVSQSLTQTSVMLECGVRVATTLLVGASHFYASFVDGSAGHTQLGSEARAKLQREKSRSRAVPCMPVQPCPLLR
jgi:hypothetical protein